MIRPDRVQERLDALNLNPFSAAGQAGLERGYVRDILRGRVKDPGVGKVSALARVLRCSVSYLLGETDDVGTAPLRLEGQPTLIVDLPIAHEVAAGKWMATDEAQDGPLGHAPVSLAPEYAVYQQWLERVRGDSMDRILPDGALVHVIDAIGLGYTPRHGDLVVVERRRAQGSFCERSLKQISIGPSGVTLWPRSHNPRWDQPLSLVDGADGADDVEVQIVGKVVRGYLSFDNASELG